MAQPEGGAEAPAVPVPAGSSWLRSLGRRAAAALVLIPIVIALVFFGGWVAFAGAMVALLLAAYELHDMFTHRGWRPLTWVSVGVALMFLVAARVVVISQPHNRELTLALLGGGLSVLLVLSLGWLILSHRSNEAALIDWALTMAGAVYLGWPLACFLFLRGDALGAGNTGFWWLLALFFMVWANDTFALLTGHYFGRHKLAPHISPAKTWEGFYGGLVFTAIAALIFGVALPSAFGHPLNLPWYHALILGVLVAVAGTVGDLAESLLKRGTGVKDSGSLIPGHGGILDRMDSLLFAVLIVLFYAALLKDVAL